MRNRGLTARGTASQGSDAEAVRAGVLGELEPLDRLAASLYNQPAVPMFTRQMTRADSPACEPYRYPNGATRFLRWHELSDEQKDKVRAALRERTDDLGVDVTRPGSGGTL